MKFGQDYEAALARGEYPEDWVNSAISYKKLKKCIKRVQQELLSLGLDKETLDALWDHVASGATETEGHIADRLMQYSIDGNEKISFAPRLTIVVDPHDGSPMDAWLSPDTRRILRRLGRASSATIESVHWQDECPIRQPKYSDYFPSNQAEHDEFDSNDHNRQLQTVEVPLTADSEFFQILRQKLTSLDELQEVERARLQEQITQLGKDLRALKASKSKQSKKEIEAWRKIFELYSEAEVFLSSHEADAGPRDATHAQKQYQSFSQSLSTQQQEVVKLGTEANVALARFLNINVNLLRLIKFQEINKTALTKIMKKFDKRTALRAQSAVSKSLTKSPFMVQDLAQATCFTISEEILTIIPQLNDYLCPICFSISFKPVRLRCDHIFCIRCMIVMQRAGKDHCPLCREEVVLEADSGRSPLQTPQAKWSELVLILPREYRQEHDQIYEGQLQGGRQGKAEAE